MIYDVEFSLDAAAELWRITEVVGSALLVLRAADQIRRHLEGDPADKGAFLSEGLYYIDEQPLCAFFLIDLGLATRLGSPNRVTCRLLKMNSPRRQGRRSG